MKMKWLGLSILLITFSSGCTSSPKNIDISQRDIPQHDIPQRMIDRPYTLMKGLSEAHLNLTWNYTKSTDFYDLPNPIPLYLYWTHAVSDDFSFIWFVLPLGFRYQWINTPSHRLGFQFFNQIGDPKDPNISPYLTFTDRLRLSEAFELQSEFGSQSHLLFKQHIVNWAFSGISGARWQILDLHLIHLWLGVLREITPEIGTWSLSSGVNYTWSISRQVNVELRIVQKLAGQRRAPGLDSSQSSENTSNTLGALSLRYLW